MHGRGNAKVVPEAAQLCKMPSENDLPQEATLAARLFLVVNGHFVPGRIHLMTVLADYADSLLEHGQLALSGVKWLSQFDFRAAAGHRNTPTAW
jgi:hypothetical protein